MMKSMVTLNCINVRTESSPHSAGVRRVSAAVARWRTGKGSPTDVSGGVEAVVGKSLVVTGKARNSSHPIQATRVHCPPRYSVGMRIPTETGAFVVRSCLTVGVSKEPELCRYFAWSCEQFEMSELASFSDSLRQSALQRFQLLRVHLGDGRSLAAIAGEGNSFVELPQLDESSW
jgi:hypothetical protein